MNKDELQDLVDELEDRLDAVVDVLQDEELEDEDRVTEGLLAADVEVVEYDDDD